MKAADLVAQKAGDVRDGAGRVVDGVIAKFRQTVDLSSPASTVAKALAEAIATLTPSSRAGYRGLNAMNSNPADWHLLRQIVTEGPVYIYLTPDSINIVEETHACSMALLTFLTEQRFVIPVLQRRNPEDWLKWEPRTPAHRRILDDAIAAGESNDVFLDGLMPHAKYRRAEIFSGLQKFKSLSNIKAILFEFPTFNADDALTSISFRVALLEAINRKSASSYNDIINRRIAREKDAVAIHDGTMFEYRTICGRAFTSFGGSFMTLGWTWDRLVSMYAPDQGDPSVTLRGDPKDMVRSFEAVLETFPQQFNSIDWEEARDPSKARSIISSIEILMEHKYWDTLLEVRASHNLLEEGINKNTEAFYKRLDLFREIFRRHDEVEILAREPLQGFSQAGRSPASVSLATGEAIGLSTAGATAGSIRPDLEESTNHLVKGDIESLFDDCKTNIRVVRKGYLPSAYRRKA